MLNRMKWIGLATWLMGGTVWADWPRTASPPNPEKAEAGPETMVVDAFQQTWQQTQENVARQLKLQKLLRSLMLKEVNFKEATIEEVMEFFRTQAKALDPEKTGVNFLLAPAVLAGAKDAKITLSLKSIPLSEALRYSLIQANLDYKIDPYAVVIFTLKKAS